MNAYSITLFFSPFSISLLLMLIFINSLMLWEYPDILMLTLQICDVLIKKNGVLKYQQTFLSAEGSCKQESKSAHPTGANQAQMTPS